MRDTPWGHGLGVVPTGHDVVVAQAGIAVAHVPTAADYLEHYMLDGSFELHSIIADLWTNAGPPGVALGLLMGGLLVGALVRSTGQRVAVALGVFLVLRSLWMLAFGPLSANLSDVAFTLGIVLSLRGAGAPPGADAVDPEDDVASAAPAPLQVPA